MAAVLREQEATRAVQRAGDILAELAEGGVEAIGVAGAMHAWRRAEPEVALYHERDTHWTSVGAWRTALLIARAIAAE